MKLTEAMRQEYIRLADTMQLRPGSGATLRLSVDKLVSGRPRYEEVQASTRVPWGVVGVIHCMEAGFRFDRHLHNGDDPLTARTRHEPVGRPAKGTPPFTWLASAIDALTEKGFEAWQDWSLSGTLYRLEAYNGWGYRNKGKPSHYLWGLTQHAQPGRWVADHVWDPDARCRQLGAVPMLLELAARGLTTFQSR